MDDAQLWEAVLVPFLTPDMSDEDVKDILADDSVVDTLIVVKLHNECRSTSVPPSKSGF